MMNQNPFIINQGQNNQGQEPLSGLAGLLGKFAEMQMNQQSEEPSNAFAQQTPGAPTQPGRVDQSSFGQQGSDGFNQEMPGDGIAGMAMDNPFWILSALIAKKFGS